MLSVLSCATQVKITCRLGILCNAYRERHSTTLQGE
jgi:hypothetical protein